MESVEREISAVGLQILEMARLLKETLDNYVPTPVMLGSWLGERLDLTPKDIEEVLPELLDITETDIEDESRQSEAMMLILSSAIAVDSVMKQIDQVLSERQSIANVILKH